MRYFVRVEPWGTAVLNAPVLGRGPIIEGDVMAHDVFISHSSADKTVADGICTTLEKNGIRCWIAPRDILPGESYLEALMEALSKSRLLVLVFSTQTSSSQHVAREVERAFSKRLPIIRFRVHDAPLSGELEYLLSVSQWLDALTLPLQPHLDRLSDTVSELLERDSRDPSVRAGADDASPEGLEKSMTPSAATDIAPAVEAETAPPPGSVPPPPPPEATARESRPGGEPQRWAIVRTLSPSMLGVNDCGFSPDGQTVFTAGWPTLKLWAVGSGRHLASLGEHTDWEKVNAGAFSPDGQTIVSAGSNKLELYDNPLSLKWLARTQTIHSRAVLKGHTGDVKACAFAPDGQTLVSGSEDKTLRLWDVASAVCRGRLLGHTDEVNGCALSADGRTIVSASGDMTLKTWDAGSGECRTTFVGHSNGVLACAFSPDGQTIVSASSDGTLRLWDAITGECRATLLGHRAGGVRACAFSPDGRTIVSASGDTTVKLWDASSGACRATLAGHPEAVVGCAFSPDGSMIVSGSTKHKKDCVRLWVAT